MWCFLLQIINALGDVTISLNLRGQVERDTYPIDLYVCDMPSLKPVNVERWQLLSCDNLLELMGVF